MSKKAKKSHTPVLVAQISTDLWLWVLELEAKNVVCCHQCKAQHDGRLREDSTRPIYCRCFLELFPVSRCHSYRHNLRAFHSFNGGMYARL